MITGVVNGLLGAPDGHWRLGGDLTSALQGGSQHLLLRLKHLVDQSVGHGFGSGQAPARVGQLFHHRQRNQLGQALQGAHVGHHADVDFLNAKEGICCGIADATSGDHIDRTTDAAALDGGNHRNTQSFQLGERGLNIHQHIEHGSAAFGGVIFHQPLARKRL